MLIQTNRRPPLRLKLMILSLSRKYRHLQSQKRLMMIRAKVLNPQGSTRPSTNGDSAETQGPDSARDEPVVTTQAKPSQYSEHGSETFIKVTPTGTAEHQEPIEHPSNVTESHDSVRVSSLQNDSTAEAHDEQDDGRKEGHDVVERPMIALQPRNSLGDIRPHNAIAVNADGHREDHGPKSEGDAVERPMIALQPRNSLGDIRPHNAVAASVDANRKDRGPQVRDEAVEPLQVAAPTSDSSGDEDSHNATATGPNNHADSFERPLTALQTRNSLGDVRPHHVSAAEKDGENGPPEQVAAETSDSSTVTELPPDHPDASQKEVTKSDSPVSTPPPSQAIQDVMYKVLDEQEHESKATQQHSSPAKNIESHLPGTQYISLAPTHHPPSTSNLNLASSSSPQNPSSSNTDIDTDAVITDSYKAFPRRPAPDSDSGPNPDPNHQASYSPPSHSAVPPTGLSMLERIAKKVDQILSHEERHFLKHFKAKEEAETLAESSSAASRKTKEREENHHHYHHDEKKADREARKREKEVARERKEQARRKRRAEGGVSWGFEPLGGLVGVSAGGRHGGREESGGGGGGDEEGEREGVEVGEQGGEGCCGHGHGGGKKEEAKIKTKTKSEDGTVKGSGSAADADGSAD
ncbi:MAG: hypothetical protein Q9160_004608 [Pyrenula sp. 1 TL-2023]